MKTRHKLFAMILLFLVACTYIEIQGDSNEINIHKKGKIEAKLPEEKERENDVDEMGIYREK